MVPLQGAIAGCQWSVVPLLGSVLWLGGRVTANFELSGRGAIAGCHCKVSTVVCLG